MPVLAQGAQLVATVLVVDGLFGLLLPAVVMAVYRGWLDPMVDDPLLGNNKLSGLFLMGMAASWLYFLYPFEGFMDWALATSSSFFLVAGFLIMSQTPAYREARKQVLGEYSTGQVRFVGLCEATVGAVVLGAFALFG